MNDDPGAKHARQRKLTAVLAGIPWDGWQAIVRKEPEWQNLAPFFPLYGFGPLATVLMAAGLNDYHLKGKAEIVYWPAIRTLLTRSSVPTSRSDLRQLFEPFYEHERESRRKTDTLKAFLAGPLAARLWTANPAEVAAEFSSIWKLLGTSLGWPPEEKQAVFGMKCLGLALLIAGESGFDCSRLPMPGDSRLRRLTKRLGFNLKGQQALRSFWGEVLATVQQGRKQVSMIHLDSLLWQIAPLQEAELKEYFADLGSLEVGHSLQVFLSE
jgi:DNA-(apurinic or apyrimidinic site) lyase